MRLTLPKSEKLKSEIDIKKVFQSSTKTVSFPLRFQWSQLEQEESCKILVGCPKKRVKLAVNRNKIKRLIREAYRINKKPLHEACMQRNVKIGLVIVFIGNEIPNFEYINKKMIKGLSAVIDQLDNT